MRSYPLSLSRACFLGFFVLNLFVVPWLCWAIPIGTLIAVIFKFGEEAPLLLGSYRFPQGDASMPCSVNKFLYPKSGMHPVITVALGGILPFGANLLTFLYHVRKLQIYYLFGFLHHPHTRHHYR